MGIPEIIRHVLKEEGRTQAWVIEEMNKILPEINMDRGKFSATVCGIRKMTADELLVFCKAVKRSPDIFLEAEADRRGA